MCNLFYCLFSLSVAEYSEPVKMTMNRKSRALVRVIERKTIKLEIFYKRYVSLTLCFIYYNSVVFKGFVVFMLPEKFRGSI